MINVGDKAPEILGTNEKGEEIRLSAYQGKKIVLYFYPKDSTSGCTAQACSLRDNYSELRKAGYEVIGVSVDNEKSHQKFIEKNNLPFTLIADTDKKLVEEFGVWGKETVWPCLYGNPPYDLPDQRRRNCRTDYHPERSENQRTCRTDFESINPSIRRIRYGKERRT